MKKAFLRIFRFYADGFCNMTWGRQLWWLVLLKFVILFAVLRLFFFKPALSGKSEAEKIRHVGAQLTREQPQTEAQRQPKTKLNND